MGSISIDQWRGRIGAFAGGFNASETKASKTSKLRSFSIIGIALSTLPMLLVYAVIVQSLLLQAGVEKNPGPNQGYFINVIN